MLELVARIVLLGTAAQDFHDERRIRDRQRVNAIDLTWPADDRDVGVSCKTRGCANTQIGIVWTAFAAAELRAQQGDGGRRERRVFGRAARHRVNLAAEEFVLDVARRLESEIVGVGVIELVEKCRHL